MEATAAGRRDYANLLAELGFLPHAYAEQMGSRGPADGFTSPYDQFSDNARIVKAAMCAGQDYVPSYQQHIPDSPLTFGFCLPMLDKGGREVRFST
jgi:hypothetical protein